MTNVNAVETSVTTFEQRMRLGLPSNPLSDDVTISGANVQRLQQAMQMFAWKDPRFVTASQAQAQGWSITPEAIGVDITKRNLQDGSIEVEKLYNAANIVGMPSLEAMLQDAQLVAPGATEAFKPDLIDEALEIGPTTQLQRLPEPTQAEDLFLGEQVDLAQQSAHPGEWEGKEQEANDSKMGVYAPYWLNRLHNYEGIALAKKLNALIASQQLQRNQHAIEALLKAHPDHSRFGLSIQALSLWEKDPHHRANVAQPSTLLGGSLVRDHEGNYRPKQGGTTVIEDSGTRLKLNKKNGKAYEAAMELALAKGWTAIEIKGKPKMLADAWLEAKLKGLNVINYQPNDQDREKLAKRMAELQAAKPKAPEAETVEVRPVQDSQGKTVMASVKTQVDSLSKDSSTTVAHTASVVRPEETVLTRTTTHVGDAIRSEVASKAMPAGIPAKAAAQAMVAQEVAQTALQDRLDNPLVLREGKLIAHGPAKFEHNPTNTLSYYAVVEDAQGQQQTLWGVDLSRSIEQSGAQLGDIIALTQGERTPVEIPETKADGSVHHKIANRVQWHTKVLEQAQTQGIERKAVTDGPLPNYPLFIGPVVAIEDGLVGQRVGREDTDLAWHRIERLDGPVPAINELLEVHYNEIGRGTIKSSDRGRELGR